MRYWLFKDYKIKGPLEIEALVVSEGLLPSNLVCPEITKGRQTWDWQAASAVPEVAEALRPKPSTPPLVETLQRRLDAAEASSAELRQGLRSRDEELARLRSELEAVKERISARPQPAEPPASPQADARNAPPAPVKLSAPAAAPVKPPAPAATPVKPPVPTAVPAKPVTPPPLAAVAVAPASAAASAQARVESASRLLQTPPRASALPSGRRTARVALAFILALMAVIALKFGGALVAYFGVGRPWPPEPPPAAPVIPVAPAALPMPERLPLHADSEVLLAPKVKRARPAAKRPSPVEAAKPAPRKIEGLPGIPPPPDTKAR